MFARAVVIKVQPGCEVELTRTFEQQVIPRFREERDFRGLLAFTVPDGTEALSLSLWDQQEGSRGFMHQELCRVDGSGQSRTGEIASPGL